MYTSVIGRKLVAAVNAREGTNLTVKDFFYQKFYPVFYDYPKYLQWITNSPFVQGYKSSKPPDEAARARKLSDFQEKVSSKLQKPDASFAVGYMADEDDASTTGQITNLQIPIDEDEIYATWIGSGLGIRVEGGLVLLINDSDILYRVYEGWKKYRQLIEETNRLKGNQIDTWNAQWLTFSLNNPDYNSQIFSPLSILNDGFEIPRIAWIRVIFELAKKMPKVDLTTYIYNLGQTNNTIGFIKILLPEVKREIDVYNALFPEFDYVTKKAIEDVYNTEFSFREVCLNGAIGIAEIRPKGLKEYLPNSNRESKALKYKNDESFKYSFHIYTSWVIAMINDKNLIQQAAEFAKELINISQKNVRGKTTETNLIKKLLESASRKAFIENLIPLLSENNAKYMNEFVDAIYAVSADKFPYLLTLIKFKYEYLSQLKTEEK